MVAHPPFKTARRRDFAVPPRPRDATSRFVTSAELPSVNQPSPLRRRRAWLPYQCFRAGGWILSNLPWVVALGCSSQGELPSEVREAGIARDAAVDASEPTEPSHPGRDASVSTDAAPSSSPDAADASPFDAGTGHHFSGSDAAASDAGHTSVGIETSTEPSGSVPTSSSPDASASEQTASESTASDSSGDAAVAPPSVGPELTDVSQFESVDCEILPNVTSAPQIPTVGVAEFETDLVDAERAFIQFGTASEYTFEAPVDWDQVGHRTLLLGVPANTEVHYRIVVVRGEQACVGPDTTYTTGGPVPGVPASIPVLDGASAAEPSPGFLVAVRNDYAYIVNNRGDVVWAYRFPTALTTAMLSWDGKYVLARDMGPFNASAGGNMFRVGLDGEGPVRLSISGGHHHHFTVVPEGIAYIAKDEVGDCDSLYTARIDGTESAPLVNLGVVFDKFANGPQAIAPERCHVNYVRYYHGTETFSLSDREKDAIAIFRKTGELLGSIGAAPTEPTPSHVLAEGADSMVNSPWRVQHGHHLYAPNKLVVWSNGVFQGGVSRVLHYTLEGTTATLDWQYTAAGNSPTLSDAQHAENGHFLVTNSATGTVHEIDPSRKLVQSYTALSRGYLSYRSRLYGPPQSE